MVDKNIKTVEQRLKTIEERNKRVELDKAWETSWMRRIVIATLTYANQYNCIDSIYRY